MTIKEFLEEYENLKDNRQRIGRVKFLELLIEENGFHEELILEMMQVAINYEQDDGFGTEGADI